MELWHFIFLPECSSGLQTPVHVGCIFSPFFTFCHPRWTDSCVGAEKLSPTCYPDERSRSLLLCTAGWVNSSSTKSPKQLSPCLEHSPYLPCHSRHCSALLSNTQGRSSIDKATETLVIWCDRRALSVISCLKKWSRSGSFISGREKSLALCCQLVHKNSGRLHLLHFTSNWLQLPSLTSRGTRNW